MTIMTPLLETIDTPGRPAPRSSRAQLRAARRASCARSCCDTVAQTGGHLSSNLGTVELTIALHYVFDTPHDRLVWDVGHQTYPHKILTGRRERMATLRQLRRHRGFPRRDESEYDTFGTAHSSTSISAALGMAVAAKLKGETRHVGRGHRRRRDERRHGLRGAQQRRRRRRRPAGDPERQRHVDLRRRSARSTSYLARLMSGKFYAAARDGGKKVLTNAPPLFELAQALRGARQGHGACRARSSRSSASTTSARSTATTSTR